MGGMRGQRKEWQKCFSHFQQKNTEHSCFNFSPLTAVLFVRPVVAVLLLVALVVGQDAARVVELVVAAGELARVAVGGG